MTPSLSGVQVRRMTQPDLDRVIEIEQRLKEAPHWPRSAYLTALDPEAVLPRISLVAEETGSGVLAGFAVASLIPPQAELESIAVAPEFQRRGLGWQLFALLAGDLREAGVDELVLEIRASNQPALGLYRRLGFVKTASRPRYYSDPIEDAVLMTLEF
jgi:ribosomal-protein-alanine N-acetyltransferase